MRSQDVKFEGSLGSTLDARLELPDDAPKAYTLFAHCFACSKDLMSEIRIARALTEYGIAVLRFDFTGLGHSEGRFEDTTFSSNVEDLLAGAAFLKSFDNQAPQLLIGHSLGGAAVLAAAAELPEVKAVATIAAPSDPAHVKHLFETGGDGDPQSESVTVQIMGRRFRLGKHFVEDVSEHNLQGIIKHLDKALLIFHSPWDRIVDIDHARQIYEAAKHPKSFVSLQDADHLVSHKKDARYIARVLSAWASRYLDIEE